MVFLEDSEPKVKLRFSEIRLKVINHLNTDLSISSTALRRESTKFMQWLGVLPLAA